MRGRDFITNKYLSLLPSLLEFTLPAMQYLTNLAANETNGTISIVLFRLVFSQLIFGHSGNSI
jgi:hypothetical protein